MNVRMERERIAKKFVILGKNKKKNGFGPFYFI
jgi:hypothetical protein